MQVSMSNHKSTESAIKSLEIQVGQLTKKLDEKSTGNFVANIEKNPKDECKVVVTRSQGWERVEKMEENTERDVENEDEREEENKQREKKWIKRKIKREKQKNER